MGRIWMVKEEREGFLLWAMWRKKCEQRDKEKGILKEQWLESSFCRCFGLSCVRESPGKMVESFEWQLKEWCFTCWAAGEGRGVSGRWYWWLQDGLEQEENE